MEWLIFLSGVFNLFLGILVFKQARTDKNLYFSIFIFFTVLLIFIDFIFRFFPILFILQSAYAFAGLVSAFALLAILVFTKVKISPLGKIFVILPGIILFIISYINGYIIEGINYLTILGFKGTNGPLFIFYSIIIAIYLIATIIVLYRSFKKSTGLLRTQIMYIMFGLCGYGTFAILFSLVLPTFFNVYDFTLLDAPSSLIFVAFTSYAIIKYRLMNIRLVLTRSILYGLLVATVASFFALSIVWTGNLIDGNSQTSKIIIYIIDSIIVITFLDPLKRILARVTDKIFYKGKIDFQVILQEVGNIVAREIDLDKLLQKAVGVLSDKLKIQQLSVLTPINKHFKLIASSSDNSKDTNVSENFIDYLSDHYDFVIVEELMRDLDNFKQESLEYKVLDKFIKEAESLKIEMVIPVVEQNKLTAIFLFSAKQSGDLYGQDDINFFKVLVPQIATAIEKSKLYEEVQELNVELQAKVEDRTKSLQEANLTLEERNKFLTTMQVVTNMVSRTLDLKKIYQMIADSIASELGYIGGILSFIDDEKKILQVGAITNNEKTQQAFKLLDKKPNLFISQLKENFNFSAKTAVTGKIVFSDKMSDFLAPPVDKDVINKIQKLLKVKAAVGVPVFSEARIIGVIQFFLPVTRDKVTSMDIEMMNALTNQVGIVSRNLKLYENLQGTNLELQEANLRLRELDKTKSEFLSIASHQLRTPISAIKGYLSMMMDGDFGVLPHNFRKIIKDLFESSARLARLINIFLNVSRIESGRLKLEKHPIQISDMIESVVQELSAQAKQKKIKLSYKKHRKKIPLIFADSDKLREVVLNLIDNSIKYTIKGSVTASVEFDKKELTFLVKDTGIGIDPAEVKGLFRKFVRGSGVAQIHTGGSGLGLFIAQKIIKEHGGKIWTESKGKEKGSTFKFTLPLYDEKKDGVEEKEK